MMPRLNIGRMFIAAALVMLFAGMLFGVMASRGYVSKAVSGLWPGFIALRPMHVSAVLFWILLAATGCIYLSLSEITRQRPGKSGYLQWALWLVAIGGIFYSYLSGQFGGREYWEFPPVWSLPIAAAWLILLGNFFRMARTIRRWPVYVWMWMTGIVFFLFTFAESYLWLFPGFRENIIADTTVQWKAGGAIVGAWNQIIYGTAFYLMDRISGDRKAGFSRLAFFMYFLGLFNLMFNWGHHVYPLPTIDYVRYIGYAVSMTEWIIFVRIIWLWRRSVTEAQKHKALFPYRFLLAADVWVFLSLAQALVMSVPALNRYTHGTHVTVAHAMGTTIGINSMILLAASFMFFGGRCHDFSRANRPLNFAFWTAQGSLLVFWLALNIAGLKKGLWLMSDQRIPFQQMMAGLEPWFIIFAAGGVLLFAAMGFLVFSLLSAYVRCGWTTYARNRRTVIPGNIQKV